MRDDAAISEQPVYAGNLNKVGMTKQSPPQDPEEQHMIIGVGIDLIEVARVQKAIERNSRFVDRVFTEREIRYSEGKKSRFEHLAARFAVKEAFFKAIGQRIAWADVETTNLPSGQPQVTLLAKNVYGFTRSHVTISHTAEYATAMVVLERD